MKVKVMIVGDHPWAGEIGYLVEGDKPGTIKGKWVSNYFLALVQLNGEDFVFAESRHVQQLDDGDEEAEYVSKKARSKRSRK